MCEEQATFTELEEWPRVCMTAVLYVAPLCTLVSLTGAVSHTAV